MKIKKNEEYIVDIIDNGFEGEGIAKIDNFYTWCNKSRKSKNNNSKSIIVTCIWQTNRKH